MDMGVARTTVSMICEMRGLQKRCYARRETLQVIPAMLQRPL